MASHNDLGQEAEGLAEVWLKEKGYEILHRNWRRSHYEIDIIARKGIVLHFVEVKALKSQAHGYPEDAVGRKKFKNLQRAADEYLFLHPGHQWIQYDILAITLFKDREHEFFLVEDVFYGKW